MLWTNLDLNTLLFEIIIVLSVIRILVFVNSPGGVLDFGLDGGVPPGPRDPNPCLE